MIDTISSTRSMGIPVGAQGTSHKSMPQTGVQGGRESSLPRESGRMALSCTSCWDWSESQGGEQIKKAVEELNRKMSRHSDAIFGIHEETGRVVIKIVDRETKEVVRELPPEKTLDMISRIWEVAGIMIDEKR